MTSRMKWTVIPLIGFVLSLIGFVSLLGSIWAILFGPFIGLFSGLFAYGAIEKTKLFDSFFEWMNKD